MFACVRSGIGGGEGGLDRGEGAGDILLPGMVGVGVLSVPTG